MNQGTSIRAGSYVRQVDGYRAFIPAPLPPHPPVSLDAELVALLSRADQAIGRLDGVTQIMPNPDLFIAMYVRREAVDSSRIEGTQSSLDDVLAFELDAESRRLPGDVEEVVNYVKAMNHGLDLLKELPLSRRLIREIHGVLLQGTRGSDKSPGLFRVTQNWIGSGIVPIERATFIPPPEEEMQKAMDNLERFLNDDHGLPLLVHCAIAHAQFETIHPFSDGNGRVGRLLITLQLVERGVLHRPLLYLSTWLKGHQQEYYDRLMAVRLRGDWEGWVRYFLLGVASMAEEATALARAIVRLRENHLAHIHVLGVGQHGHHLLDLLFERPVVNARFVMDRFGIVRATALRMIGRFEELGLLEEITGLQRDRVWRYAPYVDLFRDRVDIELDDVMPQDTVSEQSSPS